MTHEARMECSWKLETKLPSCLDQLATFYSGSEQFYLIKPSSSANGISRISQGQGGRGEGRGGEGRGGEGRGRPSHPCYRVAAQRKITHCPQLI